MRPSNYYYNVSGEEAERLLRKYGTEGEFLARPSLSQPNNYTLSVIRGPELSITHVQIQNNNGRLSLIGLDFANLSDLIQYFVENRNELRELDGKTICMKRPVCIPMSEPAARDSRGPTAERWFHADVTGQDAKERLLKEKIWTYLVRESTRAPGCYVISVKTAENIVKHIMIDRNSENGMFHVHGGDEFRTIGDLLDHYNNNPMVEEESKNVVHLRAMVPSSCIAADSIDYRYKCLEMVDPSMTAKKDGFTEEFERIQSADEQCFSKKEGKKEVNVKKNRYKNIVPYDHTRVVLKEAGDGESDYINANYIRVRHFAIDKENELHLYPDREYISTQGCLPHTVCDFLTMIWENNSRVVVMTTKEYERGREKCHRYWPELNEEIDIGSFRIKNTKEVKEKFGQEDSFIARTLMLSHKGESREIAHLQFVGWPDHGCPQYPDPVLIFLDAVDRAVSAHPNTGPPVVHCSAGIGRTGTFIVIDLLVNHIKEYGRTCTIDIPRTVLLIREQRSGMVQTIDQYKFIYMSIKTYVERISPQTDKCDKEILSDLLPLAPPPVPRRPKPDPARSYVNAGGSRSAPPPHNASEHLVDMHNMRLS